MLQNDRKSRTDHAVKSAFLSILGKKRLVDMTISEVAREAGVSRSTFYSRYGNLSNLYISVTKDMLKEAMSKIEGQIIANDPQYPAHETAMQFCDLVRESEYYAPVIKEERFLPTLLEDSTNARNLINELMDKGLDFQQAYTIAIFQMAGVFAVSAMIGCSDRDWPKSRLIVSNLVRSSIDVADNMVE